MAEFQNELAMGVLVASTAFAGLTGVVIGQIMQGRLTLSAKNRLKKSVRCSFYFGMAAVLLAILWFVTPCIWTAGLSAIALLIQIGIFFGAVDRFWSIEW